MIDARLILLTAGCVMFAGTIGLELKPAAEIEAAAAHPTATAQAPISRPVQRPKIDDLIAVSLARPLFSPSRRPPEVTPGVQATSSFSDKRLTGIVIEPDRRLAIFEVAGVKPLTLTEGETVDGWKIEAITPRDVSMIGASGTTTLQPKLDPNHAASPALARKASTPLPPANPARAPLTPTGVGASASQVSPRPPNAATGTPSRRGD